MTQREAAMAAPPHMQLHPLAVAHACPGCGAVYSADRRSSGVLVAYRLGQRVHPDGAGLFWCCGLPFGWEPKVG